MTYEEWLSEMRTPFPQLHALNSRPTSPVDEGYNCIAWAAEDSERWWWPDPLEQNYWPATVRRAETIEAFVEAYATLGYEPAEDKSLEPRKQKIAVFASEQGKPRHAARQLPDGWWTSKLGQQIDIEHELTAIEGPQYGKVVIVLARHLE